MSDANKPQDDAKIQVDADWKAQARAEKELLAQEAQAQQAAGPGGAAGEVPPADFKTLVSMLVSQALLYMGAIPDPMTGQRMAHLELARHHIDLLAVLEEKTKGNLDDEDKELLGGSVAELRQYFVQLTQQMAAHRAKQAQPGAPAAGTLGSPGAAPKPQGGPKPPGGIIMP